MTDHACETRRDCGNDAEVVMALNDKLHGVCDFCALNGLTGDAEFTDEPLEVLD